MAVSESAQVFASSINQVGKDTSNTPAKDINWDEIDIVLVRLGVPVSSRDKSALSEIRRDIGTALDLDALKRAVDDLAVTLDGDEAVSVWKQIMCDGKPQGELTGNGSYKTLTRFFHRSVVPTAAEILSESHPHTFSTALVPTAPAAVVATPHDAELPGDRERFFTPRFIKVLGVAAPFALLVGLLVGSLVSASRQPEDVAVDAVPPPSPPTDLSADERSAIWQPLIRPEGDARGAQISELDLAEVNAPLVDLSEADASWAKFDFAWMNDASMNYADFAGATFTGASLQSASLAWSDFSGADFTNADLAGARLDGAVFDDAVFRQTIMQGTDLRGVDLSKVSVFRPIGALCYDISTMWPPDFTPEGRAACEEAISAAFEDPPYRFDIGGAIHSADLRLSNPQQWRDEVVFAPDEHVTIRFAFTNGTDAELQTVNFGSNHLVSTRLTDSAPAWVTTAPIPEARLAEIGGAGDFGEPETWVEIGNQGPRSVSYLSYSVYVPPGRVSCGLRTFDLRGSVETATFTLSDTIEMTLDTGIEC